jgi:hypothetical protein
MSLFLAYIQAVENDRTSDQNDSTDRESYLAHLNVKGVLGGQFSGYLNWDSNSVAAGTTGDLAGDNDIWTVGGRQVGKLAGLDYRGEYYYQWGNANGSINTTADVDRSAYMFGLRVGKTFNNVSFKPGVTVWYDHLSGTDDDDLRDGEWSSFNTLWDTGHKFYGLQDLFLGVGGGGGAGTRGLGLQDLAIKTKINPMPGWTVKTDYHWFWTAEGVAPNTTRRGFANTVATDANSGNLGNSLGTELDVTAVTKMNANTKIMIGYSHFDATNSFFALKNGATVRNVNSAFRGSDDADWAYVQFDVKF